MECAICDYHWCWSCGMNTQSKWHDTIGIYCQLYNSIVIAELGAFMKGMILVLLVVFSPILYLFFCLSFCFYNVLDCSSVCFINCTRKSKVLYYCALPPFFLLYVIFSIFLSIVVFALTIAPMAVLLILFLLIIIFRWCLSSRKVK